MEDTCDVNDEVLVAVREFDTVGGAVSVCTVEEVGDAELMLLAVIAALAVAVDEAVKTVDLEPVAIFKAVAAAVADGDIVSPPLTVGEEEALGELEDDRLTLDEADSDAVAEPKGEPLVVTRALVAVARIERNPGALKLGNDEADVVSDGELERVPEAEKVFECEFVTDTDEEEVAKADAEVDTVEESAPVKEISEVGELMGFVGLDV